MIEKFSIEPDCELSYMTGQDGVWVLSLDSQLVQKARIRRDGRHRKTKVERIHEQLIKTKRCNSINTLLLN